MRRWVGSILKSDQVGRGTAKRVQGRLQKHWRGSERCGLTRPWSHPLAGLGSHSCRSRRTAAGGYRHGKCAPSCAGREAWQGEDLHPCASEGSALRWAAGEGGRRRRYCPLVLCTRGSAPAVPRAAQARPATHTSRHGEKPKLGPLCGSTARERLAHAARSGLRFDEARGRMPPALCMRGWALVCREA